jgi:hypothetical protein
MEDKEAVFKCGCAILWIIIGAIVGGIATNYLLAVFFTKNIPFIWDMIIGVIGGEVLIPMALIVWILKMLKVI